MRDMRRRIRLGPLGVLATLFLAFSSWPSGQAPVEFRLYLARHEETDWNAQHRLQGSADIPLNGVGRQQAATLAQRVAGLRFDAVYASALQRSRQTADLVRGSIPLTSLVGLNERRLGSFEGSRNDATDPTTAREYARRSQDPDDTLDGGESLNQFFDRVRATLSQIRVRYPAGTILIVGHGGTNQMIVRTLLGLSAEEAQTFQPANDELYVIDVHPPRPTQLWKLIASHS